MDNETSIRHRQRVGNLVHRYRCGLSRRIKFRRLLSAQRGGLGKEINLVIILVGNLPVVTWCPPLCGTGLFRDLFIVLAIPIVSFFIIFIEIFSGSVPVIFVRVLVIFLFVIPVVPVPGIFVGILVVFLFVIPVVPGVLVVFLFVISSVP